MSTRAQDDMTCEAVLELVRRIRVRQLAQYAMDRRGPTGQLPRAILHPELVNRSPSFPEYDRLVADGKLSG